MVGGFFIKHPGNFIDYDVKIINKDDDKENFDGMSYAGFSNGICTRRAA